jgi:cell growth-regulating nucleolar protein
MFANIVINILLDIKGIDEESIHAASGKAKFSLRETIIKVLESRDDKELPVKRLRKKVLAEFESTGAGSATDVKMIAKFNKIIMKISGIVVCKEVVKLLN